MFGEAPRLHIPFFFKYLLSLGFTGEVSVNINASLLVPTTTTTTITFIIVILLLFPLTLSRFIVPKSHLKI